MDPPPSSLMAVGTLAAKMLEVDWISWLGVVHPDVDVAGYPDLPKDEENPLTCAAVPG